jgi:hypothetical protein
MSHGLGLKFYEEFGKPNVRRMMAYNGKSGGDQLKVHEATMDKNTGPKQGRR